MFIGMLRLCLDLQRVRTRGQSHSKAIANHGTLANYSNYR